MVPESLISVLLILANIVQDYAQELKVIPVSTYAFNACNFYKYIGTCTYETFV